MNDALARLAAAAGIEHGYWDGLGTWRGLEDDTAAALLRALGLNPAGNLEYQARELEEGAGAKGLLPPVLIVRAGMDPGASCVVPLSLPQRLCGSALRWTLTLESGATKQGQSLPAPGAGPGSAFERGGEPWLHCGIDLGAPVPPGYHRFALAADGATDGTAAALIVAPARCYIPAALAAGRRCWGLAIQLYSLRSARNWGIGDFTDLAQLAGIAGRAGAAVIGLNPLHARHLARPDEASPYSPSSRLFLDAMYLDVEAIADFAGCADAAASVRDPAFRARLEALRAAPLVDHRGIALLKLPVLETLHRHFRAECANAGDAAAGRARDFAAFRQRQGEPLARFAEFEALRLQLRDGGGVLPGWHEWPPEWRDPLGPALAQFRIDAAERIEFQCYLQWQAELQLDAAAAAARAAGLHLGLYRDVAVGAAHDSAESWGDQDLIAQGISVGAPPDLLSRNGQNWGLPPWNPRALAARAYAPFAALLAANMRGAGALRIDHVMALARLFWIPEGMPGTSGCYVRYPFEELAAIVALESVRNRCLVIGEDLGSVPDGLRERLHDLGFLSYRVLVFERHWHGDGSFKRPADYPAQALAIVATHDMPTIADYWNGTDIARRAALGLFPEPQLREQEAGRRTAERAGILALLGELGLSPPDANDATQVAESLHAAVARTPAMLAVVQLDDLLGETEPANIPGTHREYPNWRRKLSRGIEDIAEDPRLARLAAAMRGAKRS
ncbi:MAG: 4-alpha-glucanotransferase [Betaproteobacteria bacterium]|nr:4-alpha-glucanotransferase [Betaproteobacteria bacterium]